MSSTTGGSIDFTSFLKLMAHQKASDLFITAGMPPSMKVNGKISPITQNPLTPQDLLATVYRHLQIDPTISFNNFAGRPIPILPYGQPIAQLV